MALPDRQTFLHQCADLLGSASDVCGRGEATESELLDRTGDIDRVISAELRANSY